MIKIANETSYAVAIIIKGKHKILASGEMFTIDEKDVDINLKYACEKGLLTLVEGTIEGFKSRKKKIIKRPSTPKNPEELKKFRKINKIKKKLEKKFKFGNTFVIGMAQAIAILPGISRSGSTIFTGMLLKMDREKVAKFSFLMSLPVIFGATLLKFKDLLDAPPANAEINGLVAGTLTAFISGYFAIIWLLDIVKKGKLQIFGYYCLVVALLGLVWKLFIC